MIWPFVGPCAVAGVAGLGTGVGGFCVADFLLGGDFDAKNGFSVTLALMPTWGGLGVYDVGGINQVLWSLGWRR